MVKRFLSLVLLFPLAFSMAGCQPISSAQTAESSQIIARATTEASIQPVDTEATEAQSVETFATDATNPTESSEATEPEPGVSENLWTPLCNYFIYLRETPGGEKILSKIPLGDTFALNGWHGKYAYVTYKGMQGYVTANYIQPTKDTNFQKTFTTVTLTEEYSYEQLLFDLASLQMQYPTLVHIDVIGKSELGLDIPVIKIGNPNGEYHVLMQGAMHGREHFTTCLLMAMVDYALSQNQLDTSVCYHIIPMVNPDGVILSQRQSLNKTQKEIYYNDLDAGYTDYDAATYANKWKANALGVDLNRNFPSGWEESREHPLPSSERYRGSAPLCAAESIALAEYTLANDFTITLSFHSHGSVLYYRYGNKEPVNSLSYQLALAVEDITGYIPVQYDGTTGAGYKDWAMEELSIPSLTLEIGSYHTPIIQRDIYNTFGRFQNLLPALNQWLKDTF